MLFAVMLYILTKISHTPADASIATTMRCVYEYTRAKLKKMDKNWNAPDQKFFSLVALSNILESIHR